MTATPRKNSNHTENKNSQTQSRLTKIYNNSKTKEDSTTINTVSERLKPSSLSAVSSLSESTSANLISPTAKSPKLINHSHPELFFNTTKKFYKINNDQ